MVEVVAEAVEDVVVAEVELVAETGGNVLLGMIKQKAPTLASQRLMALRRCIAQSVMGGMRRILPNITMSKHGLLLRSKYQPIILCGLQRARSFQRLLSLVGLQLLAQLQLEVLL